MVLALSGVSFKLPPDPLGLVLRLELGDRAEFESEHKAERIRRKLEANAAEGKHHSRRAADPMARSETG